MGTFLNSSIMGTDVIKSKEKKTVILGEDGHWHRLSMVGRGPALPVVALEFIQKNLKDGDYFRENYVEDEPVLNQGAANPVHKVTRRDNGKVRAVKEVTLRFEHHLSCDTKSSLTVRDGSAVKKFLGCIKESIVVQNTFFSPYIVAVYDSWIQRQQSNVHERPTIQENDIRNLCTIVKNISGTSLTEVTTEQVASLSKMQGYSIFIEMELYKENLEHYINRHWQQLQGDIRQPMEKPLDNHRQNPIPLIDLLSIVGNLANALSEVHKKDYIHCDVKPANIFVDSTGSLLLGDFGSVKLVGCQYPDNPFHGTTPRYNTDPHGPPVDASFDIWSLGWLIVRIFCNCLGEFETFFIASQDAKQVELVDIFRNTLQQWEESGRFTDNAYDLICGCLAAEPTDRHTAQDIVDKIHDLRRLNHTAGCHFHPF